MTQPDRVVSAFATAHELHRGQRRKGSAAAYITHPLGVASLVGAHGGDEDQIIAALLHDAGIHVTEERRALMPQVIETLNASRQPEARFVLIEGRPATPAEDAKVEWAARPVGAPRRHTAWDGATDTGTRASAGIYFYRMSAPGFTQTRKMVLVK